MRKVLNEDILINELTKLRYEEGYSITNLVNYIQNEYGLKERHSYEYVKKMRLKIGELYAEQNENVLEDAITKLENLYQKNFEAGKTREALEVQKELNKILKLYTQSLEVNTDKGNIQININLDE